MFLENVILAVIVLLAVYGAVSLVYTLLFSLVRPRKDVRAVIAVRVGDDAEEAVQQVSYLLARLSVTGAPGRVRIAAVCDHTNQATLSALNDAFRREPRVAVCDSAGFVAMFLD